MKIIQFARSGRSFFVILIFIASGFVAPALAQRKPLAAEYPGRAVVEWEREGDLLLKNKLADAAILAFRKAAVVYRVSGDRLGSMITAKKLGIGYLMDGNPDSALYFLDMAVLIAKKSNGVDTAILYNEMRDVYYYLGISRYSENDFVEGALEFTKVLFYNDLVSNIKDQDSNYLFYETRSYYLMGLCYHNIGDFRRALDAYTISLKMKERYYSTDSLELGDAYLNIGLVYKSSENYERAIEFLHRSLIFYPDNSIEIANALNNIGLVYYEQENFNHSLNYLRQSLMIREKVYGNNHPSVAIIYNNLGNILFKQDSIEQSMTFYYKALSIYFAFYGELSEKVAFMYNNLAGVFLDMQDYDTSLLFYEKALNIRKYLFGEKHYKVAQIYRNIGELFLIKGDFEHANYNLDKSFSSNYLINDIIPLSGEVDYEQILSVNDMVEILDLKSQCLYETYKVTNQKETLDKSLIAINVCIDLIQRIIEDYNLEEAKLQFCTDIKHIFFNAINIAYEMDNHQQAIAYIEKGKSSIIYQELIDKLSKEYSNIPNDLIEQENELKLQILYFTSRIQQAQELNKMELIDSLVNDKFIVSSRYDSLIDIFNSSNFDYYGLQQGIFNWSFTEIKEKIIEDSGIIEYFIGDSLFFIFYLSRTETVLLREDLPCDFENLVRSHIAHIKLSELDQFNNSAFELFNILIKPIYYLIENTKKLLIIPDDYLFYLPFETLQIYLNNNENKISRDSFLINYKTISYHYSIKHWFNSRLISFISNSPNGYQGDFIGFSPIIHFNCCKDEKAFCFGNTGEIDNVELFDLKFNREEVIGIKDLFDRNSNNSVVYIDSNATKENFIKFCNKFRFVHIATHGISNNKYPYLSGLFFSESKTEKGESNGNQEMFSCPSILHLFEINNLKLFSTLIVLSACETGLGKLVKGEGLLAISRAFISIGVQNVIYSLWKVPDFQSKEFMLFFYSRVIKSNNISESLQLTKLHFLNDQRLSLPIFWSSFVMMGNN
jgi:CHAT domain-containing protein